MHLKKHNTHTNTLTTNYINFTDFAQTTSEY